MATPKRLALLGVFQAQLQRAGGDAQRLRGDADAPCPASTCMANLKAEAVVADAVFLGHLHVIKEQRAGVGAADAELVLLRAALETFHAALHDEHVDAAVLLLGIGLGR